MTLQVSIPLTAIVVVLPFTELVKPRYEYTLGSHSASGIPMVSRPLGALTLKKVHTGVSIRPRKRGTGP